MSIFQSKKRPCYVPNPGLETVVSASAWMLGSQAWATLTGVIGMGVGKWDQCE